MVPWTDGAPVIFKSELLQALNLESGAFGFLGSADFEIRTLTKLEGRGWSLALMGRPCFSED